MGPHCTLFWYLYTYPGTDAERILQEASQCFDRDDIRDLTVGKVDTDLIEGM